MRAWELKDDASYDIKGLKDPYKEYTISFDELMKRLTLSAKQFLDKQWEDDIPYTKQLANKIEQEGWNECPLILTPVGEKFSSVYDGCHRLNAILHFNLDVPLIKYRLTAPQTLLKHRVNDFVTERSLNISIDNYDDIKEMKVWINPTLSDLKQLLSRYILRGLVWRELFLVWNEYEIIHIDMARIIQNDKIFDDEYNDINNNYISVVLSNENNIADYFEEWDGDAEEVNGIYYMTNYDDPTMKLSFRRSLGINK